MPDLGDAFTRMSDEQQHKKGLEALKRANGNGGGNDDLLRRMLMLMQMQESMDVSDTVPRTRELPIDYQPPERFLFGQPVRIG